MKDRIIGFMLMFAIFGTMGGCIIMNMYSDVAHSGYEAEMQLGQILFFGGIGSAFFLWILNKIIKKK